jgi:phage terminase large subunit-like protein
LRGDDVPAPDLDAFVRFSERNLTSEDGAPLVIEPFQKKILSDYFDGCREVVVLVGKKNGKSSLLAALSLFHLLTQPFAEVVVVAASRDQAGVLLRQVVGYVQRSPGLRQRLKVVQREVRNDDLGGRIRVLASDSDTVDGQLPTLCLVDELARHKSEEIYGILRDGLGPRDGRLIAISTAGDDESSPFGRLRRAAHEIPGFTRDGAYKHARAKGFAWHEWSLDPGDDIDDLALLKLANPASWIDEDELRARRDSPTTQPWQLKRFTAGIWTAGEEGAISETEWAACANSGLEIPAVAEGVIVGIDLGWRWDCTAFVPIRRESPDDAIQVHPPAILTPLQDGTSLDAEEVFGVAAMYAERWPGLTFVLDPEAGGEQLGQRIDRELPARVMTHSQKAGPMTDASQQLAEAIREGVLEHPDDQELTRHVLAAAAKFYGVGWRFVKPARKNLPIDGAIALAMAVRVLNASAAKSSGDHEHVLGPHHSMFV